MHTNCQHVFHRTSMNGRSLARCDACRVVRSTQRSLLLPSDIIRSSFQYIYYITNMSSSGFMQLVSVYLPSPSSFIVVVCCVVWMSHRPPPLHRFIRTRNSSSCIDVFICMCMHIDQMDRMAYDCCWCISSLP